MEQELKALQYVYKLDFIIRKRHLVPDMRTY